MMRSIVRGPFGSYVAKFAEDLVGGDYTLRHASAIRAMIEPYASGQDGQVRLSRFSTFRRAVLVGVAAKGNQEMAAQSPSPSPA